MVQGSKIEKKADLMDIEMAGSQEQSSWIISLSLGMGSVLFSNQFYEQSPAHSPRKHASQYLPQIPGIVINLLSKRLCHSLESLICL